MTARTYTAAEMREAHLNGWRGGAGWFARVPMEVYAAAYHLWPDPVPPSAMTVREEPDPYDTDTAWRWQPGEGVQYRNRALPSPWVVPPHLEFSDDSYSIARLALLADLAAFPMRLPDGRPCTLKGEAKP